DAKPAPVQAFEQVQPISQACVGLRLRLNRKLGSEHPGHSELATLADRQLLASNRKCVRERSRPDVDIQAAFQVGQGLTVGPMPVALTICPKAQRPRGSLRHEVQLGVTELPSGVPGEAVTQAKRPLLFVHREDHAVRFTLLQEQVLESHADAVWVPKWSPTNRALSCVRHRVDEIEAQTFGRGATARCQESRASIRSIQAETRGNSCSEIPAGTRNVNVLASAKSASESSPATHSRCSSPCSSTAR